MSSLSTMQHRVRQQSALSFLFLMISLLASSGCQNSDDQYREITEEMSSAEAEVVASTGEEKTDKVAEVEIENSESEMKDQPEASKTPVSITEVKEEKPASTEADSEKGDVPKMKAPVKDPATSLVDTSQDAGNVDSTDIVNLQAEMNRKKREQLLNLSQEETLAEPREIKLLVKDREFSKESPHDAWRVTFDDIDLLKVLNMEPVPLNAEDYLPEWLKALDGQKIVLRGWMYPPDESEGIKRFMFVRDNQICCFGRKAKVYDKLWVKLQKGETSKYIQGRPFDLVGTFKIESWPEDERDLKTGEFVEVLGLLYHIDNATIISR